MKLNVIICFFSGLTDEEIIAALEESDEEGFDYEVDDPTFQISSDNEAPVESSGEEEDGEEGDEQRNVEVAENVDEPMPGTSHGTRRPRRTAKPMTKWKANDDCVLDFALKATEETTNSSLSPLQHVAKFWPEELFEILAMETNIRFMTETGEKLKCTAPEIKRFLGISILMGTIKYPRIKKYWQQGLIGLLVGETHCCNWHCHSNPHSTTYSFQGGFSDEERRPRSFSNVREKK